MVKKKEITTDNEENAEMFAHRAKYRLTLITDMLGTIPRDPKVFSEFATNQQHADEIAAVPEEKTVEEGEEVVIAPRPSVTGFFTDEDGIFLFDYQVRGLLREAANTLAHNLKIKNLRSKFTNFVFVFPRRIFILDPMKYKIVTEPDGTFARSLRTITMQGPRTTIVTSDKVNAGRAMDIEVGIIDNKEGITLETVEKCLSYGEFQGLLQFRTGGWGRFTWERIKHYV